MNTSIISLVAIALYLTSASRFAIAMFRDGTDTTKAKRQMVWLGLVAIALHAGVLYHTTVTETGINYGISNAASLILWLIAVSLLLASLRQPLENLAIVLLPAAALALALERLFPTHYVLPQGTGFGLQVHIVLSILAYALLSLAAFQALAFALAERQMRHRRPLRVSPLLPSLETMETLLFQLIRGGFYLLSLSLVSGLMFLKDIFAQHLVHKTVLSILAWVVFAILLWGRHRFGWRGRTAVRWTIGGMASLVLAYFGTKMVLEVILGVRDVGVG